MDAPFIDEVLFARMLSLEVMKSLPVRHFDGADSWKYLD